MNSCKNELCVYWDEHICFFDSISINELGMCDNFHIVSIESEYLNIKRTELRQKYKDEEAFW